MQYTIVNGAVTEYEGRTPTPAEASAALAHHAAQQSAAALHARTFYLRFGINSGGASVSNYNPTSDDFGGAAELSRVTVMEVAS